MAKISQLLRHCLLQACFVVMTLMPGLCNQQLTSFDLVWETVNNRHFDPEFNGVNWNAQRERYRPRIQAAGGVVDFVRITNEMLHQLRLSHLLVASEEMLKIYMPTLFSEGTVGIDARWIEHRAVIVRIQPGSAGHAAALKTGYVITHIDGRPISEIVRSADVLPPYNARNYRGGVSNYIVGHINGPPGTSVSITYLDGSGRKKKTVLRRRPRGDSQEISDAMPPVFVEFEARRLEKNIGYVRFNHFAPPVDKAFADTLDTMRDTRGLVIDLRSNPGGYFRIMDTIIEKLIQRKTPPYRFKFRDRTIERILQPSDRPYLKPVVLLQDVTSTSCSEQFAACMQAIGRAVVVGERSPGYLLGAAWLRLPNGMSFMHTVLQPIPFGGRIVEGKGVTPDIVSVLDRESLLKGRDVQVEAAIGHIFEATSKP